MQIAAIVFDLDGTLLDTLQDIAESANEVLAGRGCPTHPWGAYRQFVGEGVSRLFSQALPPEQRSPEQLDACVQEFRASYRRHWDVHTRPYPGIRELLAALATRQFRMAVLSNKPHEFTEKCTARFLAGQRFDAVLGQRGGVPRKPDPAAVREIVARMSLPPERFLYLGDSGVDMRTATSAGMYPVGALWGFRPREELVADGARSLIHEPGELLDVLDDLSRAD